MYCEGSQYAGQRKIVISADLKKIYIKTNPMFILFM